MRKSIFEELVETGNVDFENEYERINNLFAHTNFYSLYTIQEISNDIVPHWKYRHRCTKFDEVLSELKISYGYIRLSGYSKDKILSYLELVYTFCTMIKKHLDNPFDDFGIGLDGIYNVKKSVLNLVLKNIESLLDELNYEIVEKEFGRCEIVEKNALSTAVAEANPKIAGKVIEYRKYDLKGQVDEKMSILAELAKSIEPLKSKFKGTTYKEMYENTTFLLNNLNIRHNNEEKSIYPELSKDKEKLEEWCDRTYNCILDILAINEYLQFKGEIEALKQKCKKDNIG